MKFRKEIKSLDDLTLIRFIVKKDCGTYFKAKGYNEEKYIIIKNNASQHLKEESDVSFHAIKEEKGVLIKKQVYYPISSTEFEELFYKFNPDGTTSIKDLNEFGDLSK
ncbi:hypothetical protein KPL33_09185 [Clostridium algidicarnis]|uniref:hypothetical protein n=1 Tax=Clostridium algidicarnis TaxID=37659 RepID=UPI001C0C2DD2|nr:hypothetical protein [Clostridium algidicarnis]MBU3207149.1 hypothetical protein [Clostridium algidicarnis]